MNKDEYDEIINGPDTYKTIAKKLKEGKSVIIGWTDEEMTHQDILFTGGAYKEEGNGLQRGIRCSDLFISIMSRGSFGFLPYDEKDVGYVAEKLSLGINTTSRKLTELINGVINSLKEV